MKRVKEKKIFTVLRKPIEEFFRLESSAGIMLILATVAAIFWINSPWHDSYHLFWHKHLIIGFDKVRMDYTIHHWVNDALMSIFFFLVGLEIKREVMAGELSDIKHAAMPIAAAIGGMVVPALIFVLLNARGAGKEGWGIPMATDIAFSIGVLSLLGKRVPLGLKVFLTALAIVDDIGAVLVITFFYSSDIYFDFLIYAFVLLALLYAINFLNVYRLEIYVFIGIVIWFLFLQSGVHPTVAGVLVAFSIPAKRKFDEATYLDVLGNGYQQLKEMDKPVSSILLPAKQFEVIDAIDRATNKVQSPLQRIEINLHEFVFYIVMPVFALANAAIYIDHTFFKSLTGTLTYSIAISLLLGKVIGISFFSWLAFKLKLANYPSKVELPEIIGLGLLGGIGFTMSLFISNLAYHNEILVEDAKTGILVGSTLAGISGFFYLKYLLNKKYPMQKKN
ncbi:MAG: Na+/H+ antiporter NhaA [Cytophagaceae bacterium]